ncbi:neural proliferation differentiation and control protein 1a [Cheilinus undulatus]|uniref:neural proliferation differentiation and control protein 1a n=1 Tax=Cheilinus undulatus TaxID=241271 RepID=UPI001BD675E0|nr:neural proliferation differentiation and control protein 1a [Cheilinus undulatus]
MLLLSSPRNGRQRRASLLLLLALVVGCVIPVSASMPAHSKCPSLIDCAVERRQNCREGSNHCGPCFKFFVENEEGKCVKRKYHHNVKSKVYSDLEGEIDYLHSIIEKQQVSVIKTTKQQNKHPAAAAFRTDAKKGKTETSNPKERNQNQLTNKTTTLAPPPSVSELETLAPETGATAGGDRGGPVVVQTKQNNSIFIILTSLFAAVGALALVMATVCFVKLKKESRLAQKVDYPAFKGSTPPAATANGSSVGDNRLAHSAQMYHYQHQKQQMLSVGNHKPEQKTVDTEVTSDEEELGGDFTVYECPGLAPTGEMEVKNPLFDDSTLQYQGNQK